MTAVAFSPGALEQAYGGTSRYIFELISHLRTQGTDAFVSSPALWNEYFLETANFLHKGLPGRQLSRSRASRKILGLYNRLAWQAPWTIKSADIIHQSYYFDNFNLAPKVPRIVTVYDMIHEIFPEQFKKAHLTSRAKYRACQEANHIITISHSTKSDLVEIFGIEPNRITTIHLAGSSAPRVGRREESSKPFLLHVGARAGYKNFPRLLRALTTVPAFRQRKIKLVVFGGGLATRREQSLIEELGISPASIRFVQGNDSVLAGYYQSAQALVYLSLYEGFGIPPIEAMASGCPVIAADRSSLPEVVGEAGILVDPEDEGKIAEAIVSILNNPSRRHDMSAEGRAHAAHFSWSKTAMETNAIYEQVLAGT